MTSPPGARRIPSSWTFTSASRLSVSISGWNTLRGLLPLTCPPPHLCPLPRWGRGEGEGEEGEGDEDKSEGGPRPGDRLRGGGLLHDPPQVHDRDTVADGPDDGQVVGDEEVGQVKLRLEFSEERQDPELHRHVEPRGDLVEHDQIGFQGERPRDGNPLALAARELVGI